MKTGVAYLAVAGTSIIWANVAAALVNRVGVRPLIAGGMALLAVGMLLFTQVSVDGTYAKNLLPGFLIIAVGLAFCFVPISIAALAGVQQAEAGLASGLINTSQQIGGAVGIALLSTIAISRTENEVAAGTAVPQAMTSGFQLAFWVGTGVALAGVVAALVLIRQEEIAAAPAPALKAPRHEPNRGGSNDAPAAVCNAGASVQADGCGWKRFHGLQAAARQASVWGRDDRRCRGSRGRRRATVSRVFTGHPNVADQTRERVLAAIRELNYRPSSVARNLSLRRTFVIGVVVPFFTNPSAVERLRGIVAGLEASPYDLALFDVESPDRQRRAFDTFGRGDRADGLLVVSLVPPDVELVRLEAAQIPCVLVDAPHPVLPTVLSDDVEGGVIATSHLLELGHRRIAFIGDKPPDRFRFHSSQAIEPRLREGSRA
jgi:hypothetical protein